MLSTQITNSLMSIFAQPGTAGDPRGFLSSSFGYYKPLVAGVMVKIIGNVLAIRNPVYLVIVRAILGVGAPLFFAVSMTFILNLFDDSRKRTAMTFRMTTYGVRWCFTLSSAILLASVPVAIIIKES